VKQASSSAVIYAAFNFTLITDFSLDKITSQYLEVADLAQFDLIATVDNSSEK
jgi:hypothetical protein